MSFLIRRLLTHEQLCDLELRVGRPAGGARGHRGLEARAIIATDLADTFISSDLVHTLGLKRIGHSVAAHPLSAESIPCQIVEAELVLRGEEGRIWTFEIDLLVAPRDLSPGLILGMDALEGGELRVHFPERRWSFWVPPEAA